MSEKRGPGKLPVELEDLTIAFLLVPGLYPRNRMYAINEQSHVRRAKRRAATLRGVQAELERLLTEKVDALDARISEESITLSYSRRTLDYRRRTTLSRGEADAMAILLGRRGLEAPWPFDPSRLTTVTDRLRSASGIELGEKGA